MNTTELIAKIAEQTGITKKQAGDVLGALTEAINAEVKGGGQVVVKDLGRFYTKQRAARTCRNPRSGDIIQVPEKTVVKFTARGSLKG